MTLTLFTRLKILAIGAIVSFSSIFQVIVPFYLHNNLFRWDIQMLM